MRTFLRRRHCLFLGTLGLAVLGSAATFVVVDLKRSAAYDRVHVGMKSIQAHRILMDAGAKDLGSYCEVGASLKNDKYQSGFRFATGYMLGTDFVWIVWDRQYGVYEKTLTRDSWPHRVLAWLAPIRVAVGL
jgi:hypothetical protein